jgi:hypothetical protein
MEVRMTIAFWRTLYTPGHDVARLTAADDGWRLSGTAPWIQGSLPARLNYAVTLTPDWITRSGRIAGFVGDETVDRRVLRTEDGHWSLDDFARPDLHGLVHLDLGFGLCRDAGDRAGWLRSRVSDAVDPTCVTKAPHRAVLT